MRVLFVYSLEDAQGATKPLWSWSTIQFGISYISSALKAGGHETSLVVLGSNNDWQRNIDLLAAHIHDFSPDIVGATAVASQHAFIQRLAVWIKSQWPHIYLVLGGVHATLNPMEAAKGAFDAICVGEGEYPTLELCRQMERKIVPHAIPNMWIKRPDDTMENTPPRPFLRDINELPFPDRIMWAPWMRESAGNELSVLLGRGCPYNCTYCCNHALKNVADGPYVRMRSPENIIREIAYLREAYPDQSRIYLEVESIALDRPWLMDLCDRLHTFNDGIGQELSYGVNFRISPASLDEEVFQALKRANVKRLNIGLESGCERVRREVLKRHYSNADFFRAVSLAREAGFAICLFNMIGLPGESCEDYWQTVALNRQCQPEMHYTGIFFPYPGTELYDKCLREGLLSLPLDQRLERRRPVIENRRFTKAQIRQGLILFNYRVYKGHKPIWWLVLRTVVAAVNSSVRLSNLFRAIARWPMLCELRAKLAVN